MSARVAYFERADRGTRPLGVRLVGDRTDESHRCADGDPVRALAETASWIREHLPRNTGGRPLLDLLCVDVEGSLCSWLTAPSGEMRVIDALARQGDTDWSSEGDGGDTGGHRTPTVLAAYAGEAGEASLQAMVAPPADRPSSKKAPGAVVEAKLRLPVLAVPDSAARVLVDSLDTEGVRVDAVCSLWHAVCAAWDPAGPASPAGAGRRSEGTAVVADTSPVSASVLVDPGGRLLWTWSRAGALLAAGSMRLRVERTAEGIPGMVRVRRADASRLAAEWLAWSAQLATAPSRVSCVTPELWAAEEAGEGSLDAAGLGTALGRAMPGATVDLAVDSDPVGATLRRLASGLEALAEAGQAETLRSGPSSTLVSLSRRPGQAHFRLHLWTALAIAMAAAGVGALAWKFRAEAAAFRDAARRTSTQARELFQNSNVGPSFPGKELETVQTKVAALEQAVKPVKAEAVMPILSELETLSLVLAVPGVELTSITLDSRVSTRIEVVVPSVKDGEELLSGLRAISGSALTDWTMNPTPIGASGKIRCSFSAGWSGEARRTPGESAS